MTAETSSPYAVGVAAFDLTPAPGRLWGRMRGLAVVIEGSASPLALVALDGVRVPPGFGAKVAELLGWPVETVAIWPGGKALTDVSVAAVAEAIQEARAQGGTGHVRHKNK